MAKKSFETFQLEPWMHEHVQAITISVAKQALREEQARGFDRQPLTIVDRRPNLPFEAVRPFGRIEIIERVEMGEIIEFIFRKLHEKSPVGDIDSRPGHPGFYRNSHFITVNGNMVTAENVKNINYNPERDTVRFVNAAIYARKIEGIYTASRFNKKTRKQENKGKWHTLGWSPQAPKGVYRVVARMAKQKYGKNAAIRYTVMRLSVGGAQVRRWYKSGKKLRRFEMTDQVYPVIELSPRKGGIII